MLLEVGLHLVGGMIRRELELEFLLGSARLAGEIESPALAPHWAQDSLSPLPLLPCTSPSLKKREGAG